MLLMLSACAPATPEQIEAEESARIEDNSGRSRLVAVVDGCRIWEVYNDKVSSPNPFFARCPEGAASTFETHKSGKTRVETFTVGK